MTLAETQGGSWGEGSGGGGKLAVPGRSPPEPVTVSMGLGGGWAVSEDPPSQGLCLLPPAASTGGGPELQLCPQGCPESPALTLANTGVPGAAPPKTVL